MALQDLSFIDEIRALEHEAIDGGRCTSEFTLAPGPTNFGGIAGETEEEALHGRPVDDVVETEERVKGIPKYIALAELAFKQRGLIYPFTVDSSEQALLVKSGYETFAVKVAELSRIIRVGIPVAGKFEKRAFRALHKHLGGWGVCVGSPREADSMGEEKTMKRYRELLQSHEQGSEWPAEFSPNGDGGADGFLILGRGWGGPIAFYQSKNSGFDLEVYPNELARIPSIFADWFGRKISAGRQVIPVLALNTVLTLDLKEQIYGERGQQHGVHIIDAVDILAAEETPADHISLKADCIVI